MQEKDDFKALLLKKANGYDVQEVVEEFTVKGEVAWWQENSRLHFRGERRVLSVGENTTYAYWLSK